MNRHPQRSTLFPYTTPSRSDGAGEARRIERRRRVLHHRHCGQPWVGDEERALHPGGPHGFRQFGDAPRRDERSEEHTSELQSRQYLVCRLLLEKKKTITSTT